MTARAVIHRRAAAVPGAPEGLEDLEARAVAALAVKAARVAATEDRAVRAVRAVAAATTVVARVAVGRTEAAPAALAVMAPEAPDVGDRTVVVPEATAPAAVVKVVRPAAVREPDDRADVPRVAPSGAVARVGVTSVEPGPLTTVSVVGDRGSHPAPRSCPSPASLRG